MIIIFIIFKSLKNKEYLSDDNKYYESLDLLSSHYNLSQKKKLLYICQADLSFIPVVKW